MKITMLETAQGSPDGASIKGYFKGETYEVPEELARVFIKSKAALAARQMKDAGAAAENK